jgi:hypothetical protein
MQTSSGSPFKVQPLMSLGQHHPGLVEGVNGRHLAASARAE